MTRAEPIREGPWWDALRTVIDPELGVDIVSLGLVRELTVEGAKGDVRMTLSTKGCPVGPAIVAEVTDALRAVGVAAEVTLEFEPPWSPDDITAAGRRALGMR